MIPRNLSRFLSLWLVLLAYLFFLGSVSTATVHAAALGQENSPNEESAPAFFLRIPSVMNSEEPPPPSPFTPILSRMAAGSLNSCALSDDGGAYCWGAAGGLGNGTTLPSSTPVAVDGLQSGVRAIDTGGVSCALLENGSVKCWGAYFVQDPFLNLAAVPQGQWHGYVSPVTINGFSGEVASIFAGGGYGISCAVLTTGAVQCWSLNENGISPVVTVTGLESGILAITGGYTHFCALMQDRTVKCWGDNRYAQLGDRTTDRKDTPVYVLGLVDRVKNLAAGGNNTCALLENGQVQCWGQRITNGDFGGLPPTIIEGFTGPVAALSVGGIGHKCALLEDGGVQCWGENMYGQLGKGSLNDDVFANKVSNINNAIAIDLGAWHSCALLESGDIQCWGYNANAQLGNGPVDLRLTPTAVVGLGEGIVDLDVGYAASCVALASGAVQCWGNHTINEMGGSKPAEVSGLRDKVRKLDVSSSCGVLADDTLQCWDMYTNNPEYVPDQNGPVKIKAGNCVLLQSGMVQCWPVGGRRPYEPTTLPGLEEGVVALDVTNHGCALLEDGTMKCWGSSTILENPVDVSGLGGPVKAIALGDSYSCALLESGAVKCWGSNYLGRLGDGTTTDRSTPTQVVGLDEDVIAIAADTTHTCALLEDGGARCWGDNSFGQLGNGTTTTQLAPVEVQNMPEGAVDIAVGVSQSCVLLESDDVYCWGQRDYVGDGVEYKRELRPVNVVWPPAD